MNGAPGQTAGPFLALGLALDRGPELVPPAAPGAVRLHGRVLDGAGEGVPDAVVELWQAGPDGRVRPVPGSLRRDGWTFTGWGRCATDADGSYAFSTLEPGATAPGRPPFFAIAVLGRGLLDGLFTRAYLPAGDDLLTADPLLAGLPPERRATLVAARTDRGLRFDIRLQGAGETVFLCYPKR